MEVSEEGGTEVEKRDASGHVDKEVSTTNAGSPSSVTKEEPMIEGLDIYPRSGCTHFGNGVFRGLLMVLVGLVWW